MMLEDEIIAKASFCSDYNKQMLIGIYSDLSGLPSDLLRAWQVAFLGNPGLVRSEGRGPDPSRGAGLWQLSTRSPRLEGAREGPAFPP